MQHFTRDGLTFDVTDDGPADGRVVIALHGFPEDRRCWDGLLPQLTAAGCRVLAPDQRGYSPGARPRGRRAYTVAELAADVLALADVAGAERFDLIGHDWGAAVAWQLAAHHGRRVRTLTALSVPHPKAMADALLRSRQLARSWYMLFFQIPRLPEWALRAAGPERAVASLERDGLDPGSARRYALRMQDLAAMKGAINWYRAIPLSGRGAPAGPGAPARQGAPAKRRVPSRQAAPGARVTPPTLMIWGDRDRYVTRAAVERSARYVEGPYRLEVLAGATHWLPTGATEQIGPLILEHLRAHPD